VWGLYSCSACSVFSTERSNDDSEFKPWVVTLVEGLGPAIAGCEQQKSMVVASWDVVESFLLASPLVNVDLSRIDGWMAASPD
jgi:hypothetical protein